MFIHTFKKHFALEPLADQPAVVVSEGDDHGSNMITLDEVSELFETQHSVQFGLWFRQLIVRHNVTSRTTGYLPAVFGLQSARNIERSVLLPLREKSSYHTPPCRHRQLLSEPQ